MKDHKWKTQLRWHRLHLLAAITCMGGLAAGCEGKGGAAAATLGDTTPDLGTIGSVVDASRGSASGDASAGVVDAMPTSRGISLPGDAGSQLGDAGTLQGSVDIGLVADAGGAPAGVKSSSLSPCVCWPNGASCKLPGVTFGGKQSAGDHPQYKCATGEVCTGDVLSYWLDGLTAGTCVVQCSHPDAKEKSGVTCAAGDTCVLFKIHKGGFETSEFTSFGGCRTKNGSRQNGTQCVDGGKNDPNCKKK